MKPLCQIDSLANLTDSVLDVQHAQLTRLDSFSTVSIHLMNDQNLLYGQIDSIHTDLQSILVYGAGFSDVISHITIPLIITLFAFAFPFLFTVITHINNKYKSEHITGLFSSDPSYKWFMRAAVVSPTYLILVGILSLCLKNVGYNYLMIIIDWTSIIVACGYSVIILMFVRTCIDYNDPQKLLERVDVKFWRGVKDSKEHLKKLRKQEKKNTKTASKCKRRFKDHSISLSKAYAFYGVEDARTRNLIELCKYAFRNNDYNLFLTIMIKVNNLPHPEKHYESQKLLFFEQVIDAYLFETQNVKVEETLMRDWFMSFNQVEKPNLYIIYRMLGKVVTAAINGQLSVFEQYIQHASYGYNYINQLQIVSYVRGRDVAEQKEIDAKRLDYWSELCEVHFIALAHLFSAGKYDAIKVVMSGKNSGHGHLFQNSGTEVLKLYAKCKEHQSENGTFDHYFELDEVIGKNTDPEMLEKLTSFLLLLASELSYSSLNLISQTRLDIIRNAESKMAKFAEVWIKSSNLLYVFPQIGGKDFNKCYQQFVGQFNEADAIEKKIENQSFLTNIMYILARVFCGNCVIKSNEDIFQRMVPDQVKNDMKNMFDNILYGNRGCIINGLYGDDDENKTEPISMGEWVFTTYKQALLEQNGLYTHHIFNNVINIFKSRYLFMVYSALANMDVSEKSMPIDIFEDFFDEYVGEKGNEYLIIDANSHLNIFYQMDEMENRYNFLSNKTFKGSDYRLYDLNVGWYLKDISELDPFRETLVIIRKIDLPAVINTADSNGTNISFKDESDRTKGIAAVSMTVYPNYEIKYNKAAKIVRIRLEPMKKRRK